MSSISSVSSGSYSAPVASSTSLSSVSYSDLASQALANAASNLRSTQTNVAKWTQRTGAYNNLASALQAFIGQLPQFRDQTQVAALTASSSNTGAIGVQMNAQGVAGTYTVSVNGLAQGQVNKSKTANSANVAAFFGNGTLSIKAGASAAVSISISNSMTLTALANAINNAQAGVTAQVTGSGTSSAVTVSGNGIGAANAVTYTESGSNTGIGGNVVQAAADAAYTVNGKSYTSGSNTAINGVPGVSLTLLSTVQNATITVAASASAVVSSLTSFVNDYNAVINAINAAQSGSPLPADAPLSDLKRRLEKVVGNVSSSASGVSLSLADAGITHNGDGTLTINDNLLAAAAAAAPGSVASLLTGSGLGTTGLGADLAKVAAAAGEPGVGTLDRSQAVIARFLLRQGRDALREQRRLDTLAGGLADSYVQLQVALSKYAAQSMSVSALTSSVGITNGSYDLTRAR
jgi:flagellar hook-associated protein 2